MNETQTTIGLFVFHKIGSQSIHVQAKKLAEEVAELLEAIKAEDWEHAKEEVADVLIVTMTIAWFLGMRAMKAVNAKMKINRNRVWQWVNGVPRHVG